MATNLAERIAEEFNTLRADELTLKLDISSFNTDYFSKTGDDITFYGNLIPSTTETWNIGSATNKIQSLYVAANTIYLGDNTTIEGTSISIDAGANPTSLADTPTIVTSSIVAKPFTYNPGAGNVTVRPSIAFQDTLGNNYPISFDTANNKFSFDDNGNYGQGSIVAKNMELSGNVTIDGTVSFTTAGGFDMPGYDFAETLLTVSNDIRVDGNTTLGYDATDTITLKGTTSVQAPLTFQDQATLGDGNDTITVNSGLANNFLITAQNIQLNSAGVLTGVSITESQISDFGSYEPADATILKDADIGVTVQAYDANNALIDTAQTWTASQSHLDNVASYYGSSNDLSIYHNGTDSLIQDTGTGNLAIGGDGTVAIMNSAFTENKATFVTNGGCTFYYDNAAKLSTQPTGIDIAGNITLSGTVDGRDILADGTKLDGIEAGATGDQTPTEIRAMFSNGTGVTITDGSVAIGQDVSTTADVTFNNITTTGYIAGPATMTIDPAAVGDNTGTLIIAGDLTVQGTTTTVNSNNVNIGDAIIVLNADEVNAASQNAGITVERGTDLNVSFLWDEAADRWTTNGQDFDVANIIVSGLVDGRDIAVDGSKLDGIEAGATADQTAGEILTLIKTVDGASSGLDADLLDGYNSDVAANGSTIVLRDASGNASFNTVYSSALTTTGNANVGGNIIVTGTVDGRDIAADGSKLDGIEAGATGDMTATEILTLIKTVDGAGSGLEADFLDGIQADSFLRRDQTSHMVTDARIIFDANSTWGARLSVGGDGHNSDATTASVSTTNGNLHLDASSTVGNNAIFLNWYTGAGGIVFGNGSSAEVAKIDSSGNLTLTGTVDGRDVAADGSKLDGIEAGATADQTAGEIKTAYESNANTNAFTDALLSKLNGIEAGATAEQAWGDIGGTLSNQTDLQSALDAKAAKNGTLTETFSAQKLIVNTNNQGTVTDLEFNANANIATDNSMYFYVDGGNANTTDKFYWKANAMYGTGTDLMNLDQTGTLSAANFNTTSDSRFKEDLVKIEGALDKIDQLTGYTFTMIESGVRSTGLIAQDVEEVLPEVIGGDDDKKTVAYGNMMGLIVEAIKELRAEIADLKK